MIGAFLPLSRGGVIIAVISCASVMYGFGLRHAKTILVGIVLAAAVMVVVPQAVWSRMSFSFEEREGKMEGRARVYKAAIDYLPDYLLAGVGAGNFWSAWGRKTAFGESQYRVSGSHNSLLQVTLYWGIGGLFALLLIFWQAYRCLPQDAHREAASLSLIGLSVSLVLYAQVVHSLYAKEFCLGLGLLAGAHCWIWPRGIVARTS
jgi:O-antigen ligase